MTYLMTRRVYLANQVALAEGCSFFKAHLAVASAAIEHPEWDLDERKTWDEWEADG